MKVLIPILIGLFVVGCGKKEDGNTGVVNPNSPSTESAPEKLIINPIIVEKAIRKAAKKPTGEPTKADYDKVTELDLSNKQLTEVPKGLEKLTKLTELDLSFNQLTDVKGLGKLTQLERLSLGFNQLTDVKGLEKLDQLWGLYLVNNQLTNVKGLEKLTQLTNLLLERNPDLTKAQIAELQKALPKCKIEHNAK